MQSLRLVHPRLAPPDVQVDFGVSLRGDRLEARFEVSAPAIHANPALARDSSQWGLWESDVVELFLATEAPNAAGDFPRYFEFQLSPLGQYFELEIFRPRVDVNREFSSGFSHEVERSRERAGSWTARMSVPLRELGWRGEPSDLRGGAFAILGPAPARTYWSQYLDQQNVPDFHLPKLFGALI